MGHAQKNLAESEISVGLLPALPTFASRIPFGSVLVFLAAFSAACNGSQATEPIPSADVNRAPVAVAGSDQMATTGSIVELDGTGSSDPNRDELRFGWSMWSRPIGSSAVLQDSTSTTPFLTTDVDGQYLISLVVDDGRLASAPDTVAVLAFSPSSGCAPNPSPVFTRHITDLSQLEIIVPPGSLSGDHISSHSYVGNALPTTVPVYAPVDAHLVNGAYYHEGGLNQYSLLFRVSCEVTFVLDHFVDPIDSIRSMFPDSASDHTRTGPDLEDPLPVHAGDLLGYTTGVPSSGRWDFGVYNTEHMNTFGNNTRYESNYWWRDLNSDCPYDYFSDPLREEYYARLGTAGGTLVPGADCRGASQDVAGTPSGAWFLDSGQEGAYGARMAIAATLDDGQVRMGGVGSGLWIDLGEPTFALPADITDEHCYLKNGTVVYLKVLSSTELMVYYQNPATGCPSAIPSAQAKIYVR